MNNSNQKMTLDNLIEQNQDKSPAPHNDLWPGIESQLKPKIEETGSKNAFWYGALAASLAIATFIGGWQLSLDTQTQPTSALYMLAQKMNKEQQVQVSQLKVGYQQAGYQQTSTQMLSELKELEIARQEITHALESSPSDSELLDLLIWVNQQELNLLSQSYQPQNQQLQEI